MSGIVPNVGNRSRNGKVRDENEASAVRPEEVVMRTLPCNVQQAAGNTKLIA